MAEAFPATANVDPIPESTFRQLLSRSITMVLGMDEKSLSQTKLKFDVNSTTNDLENVLLLSATSTGQSKRVNGRHDKFYTTHEVVKTTSSMQEVDDEVPLNETVWINAVNESAAASYAWPYQLAIADPVSLMRKFFYAANSVDDLDACLDVIGSDVYQTAIKPKTSAELNETETQIVNSAFGDPIAKLALRYPDQMSQIRDSLLNHVVQSADKIDFSEVISGLDSALNSKLTKMLDEGTIDAASPLLGQVADLLEPFEELNYVTTATRGKKNGVLTNPRLIVAEPISELMLRSLIKEQIANSERQSQTNAFVAKRFLHAKLTQFISDPTRHAANVAIIMGQLFPERRRPESLSRFNLIRLSNQVTANRNMQPGNPREPLIDLNQTGNVALAIYNVLSITTAHTADSDTALKHRVTNGMVSDIIGLLLESNFTPQFTTQEREVGVSGLGTYVRARRKVPGVNFPKKRLHEPGAGMLS